MWSWHKTIWCNETEQHRVIWWIFLNNDKRPFKTHSHFLSFQLTFFLFFASHWVVVVRIHTHTHTYFVYTACVCTCPHLKSALSLKGLMHQIDYSSRSNAQADFKRSKEEKWRHNNLLCTNISLPTCLRCFVNMRHFLWLFYWLFPFTGLRLYTLKQLLIKRRVRNVVERKMNWHDRANLAETGIFIMCGGVNA